MAPVRIGSVAVSASLPSSADDSVRLKNIHKLRKFEPCPKDLGSLLSDLLALPLKLYLWSYP